MESDPIQTYARRVQSFRTSYRAYNAKPRGPIGAAFHVILTLVILLLMLVLIIPILLVLFVVGLVLFGYFKIRRAIGGPRAASVSEGRENVRVIERD